MAYDYLEYLKDVTDELKEITKTETSKRSASQRRRFDILNKRYTKLNQWKKMETKEWSQDVMKNAGLTESFKAVFR